jgi:macrolide transport system ATP-binding/permease protein
MIPPRWLQWRSRQELDDEIRAHIDLATQAGIDRGLSPEHARYAALREMGNTTCIKERAREADPLSWIESIVKDLRYATRSLARNPSFTSAAVLSLALGIGANSAIFSFVDYLLLRPLGVPRPSEMVRINASTPESPFAPSSYREYTQLREQNHTLAGVAAETDTFLAVQAQAGDLAQVAYGDFVSGDYFSVMGVQAILGRTFSAADDSPAMLEIPVVLSRQAWEGKFHSDPHIVGSRVRINSQPATILGVLPESFRGTLRLSPEVYLPLHAVPRLNPSFTLLTDPLDRSLEFIGRLKPGVGLSAAQADFATLGSILERTYPDTNRRRTFAVLTDRGSRFQRAPQDEMASLGLLFLAFAVLRIACINVANLLLGRNSARAREIAIRLSVGASRARLIRQLLTESVLLAVLGTALGLLAGRWAIDFLASIRIPSDLPILIEARMDTRVLLYSLAAMVAALLMFGVLPAFRATRGDFASSAKESSAGKRPRNWLITLQAGLSVLTLALAALLVKNFVLSSQASPGFRTENVLLMTFDPSTSGYSKAQVDVFYRQLQERVRALPGVRDVALGSHVQLGPSYSSTAVNRDGENLGYVVFNKVGPGFFDTMATPILRGRVIDDRDTEKSPRVIVVNETLGRRLYPDGSAVGRHVRMYSETGPMAEIVGVARDTKVTDASEPPKSYMYIPNAQDSQPRMTLFIHTAADPAAMAAPVRGEVKALDPNLLVFDIRTMRDVFEGYGLLALRIAAQTTGAMGAIALALSALGLYAVMAFTVARKTREIGIRMALGATAGEVQREVLRAGLKSTALGIALGVPSALIVSHYYVSGITTYVNPKDPAIFIGSAFALALVALAACWAPARRASKVDPAITLRYE